MFLSTGFLGLVFYGGSDMYCAAAATPETLLACLHDVSPGRRASYAAECVLYSLQVAAVWWAMLQLRLAAQRQAAPDYAPLGDDGEEEGEKGGRASPPRSPLPSSVPSPVPPRAFGRRRGQSIKERRGGLLARLIAYEVCCFGLCAALFAAAAVHHGFRVAAGGVPRPEDWTMIWTTGTWCKTLYGLLAAPYLLFMLPLVGDILLQVPLMTGYDEHGAPRRAALPPPCVCVPAEGSC